MNKKFLKSISVLATVSMTAGLIAALPITASATVSLNGYEEVASMDFSAYSGAVQGKVDANLTADGAEILDSVSTPLTGYTGKYAHLTKSGGSLYYLSGTIGVPFIVTAKYYTPAYDSSNKLGDYACIDYGNGNKGGNYTAIGPIQLSSNIVSRDTQNGVNDSSVRPYAEISEGWHTVAVVADINGNVTVHYDNLVKESARKIDTVQLGSGTLRGVSLRNSWGGARDSYLADIHVYKPAVAPDQKFTTIYNHNKRDEQGSVEGTYNRTFVVQGQSLSGYNAIKVTVQADGEDLKTGGYTFETLGLPTVSGSGLVDLGVAITNVPDKYVDNINVYLSNITGDSSSKAFVE